MHTTCTDVYLLIYMYTIYAYACLSLSLYIHMLVNIRNKYPILQCSPADEVILCSPFQLSFRGYFVWALQNSDQRAFKALKRGSEHFLYPETQARKKVNNQSGFRHTVTCRFVSETSSLFRATQHHPMYRCLKNL